MHKVENQNKEFKQVWNEGGLPPGINVSDLKKWHLSRPRNELLADVFFKAGMIEAWGRGTVKIMDECKKAGLPEPEFKEEFGGLSVHFHKGKSEKKVGGQLGDGLGEKRGESGEKVGRKFEPESNKNSGSNRH
ncbi:MAG: ATP-dependent DNA helicase RecG [Syntrophaceae bacterium]|nr:MAG: ATP-dependent DNA helicase RecG [Syntrophaceae bacterium]